MFSVVAMATIGLIGGSPGKHRILYQLDPELFCFAATPYLTLSTLHIIYGMSIGFVITLDDNFIVMSHADYDEIIYLFVVFQK